MMGGSAVLETHFHRVLPPDVEMATTRVPFHKVSYQGLLEMMDRIPEAARILSEARPNVIAVTSFTGSCIRGSEMVNEIQQATGIPAIVPAREYVRLLKRMNARRIAIVTCFNQELRMLEQIFFRNNQIEVKQFVAPAVFQGDDPFQISQLDHDLVLRCLREEDLREVDAVAVDLPTFILRPELQRQLEEFLPIPVLTMADVLLWSSLEKVGIPTDQLYLGKFLLQNTQKN